MSILYGSFNINIISAKLTDEAPYGGEWESFQGNETGRATSERMDEPIQPGGTLSEPTSERTPHFPISNGLFSTRPSSVNIPDDGHAPLWMLATATERRAMTEQAGQEINGKDAAKRVMQGTFQHPQAEIAEFTVEQPGERTIDLTDELILLDETASGPTSEHASISVDTGELVVNMFICKS